MSETTTIYVESRDPVLVESLTGAGFRVVETLEAPPTLVVLDLDGAEQPARRVAELRALHPDAPPIVVSAQTDPRFVVEMVRAGAGDWLVRPLDAAEVKRVLETALTRRQLRLEGRSVRRFLEEQGRQVEDDRRLLNERVAAMAAELQQAHQQLEEAHRELRGRVAQLVMIYRIGRDLTTQRNWDDALENLLSSVCRFLDARGAALLLRSKAGEQLSTRSAQGISAEDLEHATEVLRPVDFSAEREPLLVALEDLERGDLGQACVDRRASWNCTVVPLSHGASDVGYLIIDKSYEDGTSFADDYYFLITIQTVLTEEVASAQAFSQLRKLQRFHERTLDHLESGILTVDETGRIRFANAKALRMLGIADPTRADLDAAIRLGAESPPLRRWLAGITDAAPASIEGWVHPGDGSTVIPVSMVASALPGDLPGEVHHVVVLEDRRQLQALESERRRAARQKELLIMAAEWAHDVRTPLTGILHSSELLATAVPENSPKRRHLKVITDEVQRINELVNHFLDYARPVSLKAQPQEVGALVLECVELMRGAAARREIELRSEVGAPVRARLDRDQCKQVLLNLIQNAIEAAPTGSTVLVRLRPGESESVGEPRAFELDVIDRGPGVPEEQIDRLFVPFFTTKSKGTGLGLAISEKIVRAHDGTLRYRREGETTVMRIQMPALAVDADERESSEGVRRPEFEAKG